MSIFRANKIIRTLFRYRLDTLLPRERILLKLLALFYPSGWGAARRNSRAVRLREALITLGPIFIKFGQILSTRRDLLPDDIADELATLQDQVPPFSSEQALAILEQTYGKPIGEVFKEFSSTPLASASVAQVHVARLFSGEEVVVKIVRPDIRQIIAQDIRLMYFLARIAPWFFKDAQRFRLTEVVAEFESTIFAELDMACEAGNAAQLRHNFENSNIIYVPKTYFDYTHANVLVLERVYGIRISDIATLKQRGVDLEKLARHGVEIFMTQVFRDRFFHADMHPGNVLVNIDDPQNPIYCAVDFGIIGTLSENDQYYLAQNFLAFFHRDYERIAQLHIDSGWVKEDTNLAEFTAAIRTVCEPILEKPISEISFGQLLLKLFQTARKFNMEVQPQLLLLQKTFLNIEGLGRELYPQLDLYSTVFPFLEKWAKDRYSIKNIWRQCRQQLPAWLELLPKFPQVVQRLLQKPQSIPPATKELQKLRQQNNYWRVLCGVLVLVVISLSFIHIL